MWIVMAPAIAPSRGRAVVVVVVIVVVVVVVVVVVDSCGKRYTRGATGRAIRRVCEPPNGFSGDMR
jgi:hypothetical protein